MVVAGVVTVVVELDVEVDTLHSRQHDPTSSWGTDVVDAEEGVSEAVFVTTTVAVAVPFDEASAVVMAAVGDSVVVAASVGDEDVLVEAEADDEAEAATVREVPFLAAAQTAFPYSMAAFRSVG